MSGAPTNRNPGHLRPGVNVDRPNGASALSASDWPPDLLAAALHGNRASRRAASRKLKRMAKADMAMARG
jgi:hypothetical protein